MCRLVRGELIVRLLSYLQSGEVQYRFATGNGVIDLTLRTSS